MSVEDRVKKVVAEILKVDLDGIRLDQNFTEDLGAQSVQSIELVAAFEEEFDIEMDEDDALAVMTVGGAIEFIQKYL
jgi:acyl carrier protein